MEEQMKGTNGLVVGLAVFFISQGLWAQQQEDALVAFRQGRYRDAVRITTMEIAAHPGNMDSYAVQGWALLRLEQWANAVDLVQRALQISRYDHRLIAVMGEAQYKLGNDLVALQYLQEYVAIRPQGGIIDDVYSLMGEVHIRLAEYHRADIAYSTAVYYDGANANWWTRLGFAREKAGNVETALAAYRRALEMDSAQSGAREAVGRLED